MLKRLSIFLFIGFYLTVSLGLVVQFHYCAGKLSQVEVFNSGHICGCGDHSEKAASCCSDTFIQLGIEEEQQINSTTRLAKVSVIDLIANRPSITLPIAQKAKEYSFYTDTSPPLPSKLPIYILQSNLTLYG